MKAPQSALSRKLSREYPHASRRLNRAIRRGVPVEIILENGSRRTVRSTPGSAEKDTVTIDLSDEKSASRKGNKVPA